MTAESQASTSRRSRGMLPAMGRGTRSFVGRGREIDEITAAIDAAAGGRGSLWFVVGEPGIGKSRLAEEVARIAAERHVHVLWGRCWEAGGAPAYWPFIQVTRSLFRGREGLLASARKGPRGADLMELLPELREDDAPSGGAPALEPEQAQFRLLDSLTAFFCDAAAASPIVVVLEDLHAADPSSMLLLDFLSRQLPVARLVVLGTYRETDAQRGPIGRALARLANAAHVLPLRRLGRDEVADFLEQAQEARPSPALVDAVFAATEGNPLFVGEVARRSARLVGEGGPELVLPPGIKAAVRERLDALTPEARAVLVASSVIGRDFRAATVGRITGASTLDVARALGECVDAEVVEETAPGQLRFAHILFRQVLYGDLPEARRHAFHRAVAASLEADGMDPLGTERAHHLLAAGDDAGRDASKAALHAARRAAEQHALTEAAAWHARALEALSRAGGTPEERCDLLLGLGEAQILAHDFEAGRRSCEEAAAIARSLGDAERFARAALAWGAVFVLAEVSPPLIALLREALDLLGPGDRPLRALVMARLAAALQPAADTRPPITLALEAIAMARRIGDRPTLLATLRAGGSALMDLAPPEERLGLNLEHVQIAEELGNLPDAFRGHLRLVCDRYELGDIGGSMASIDACGRIANELGQPHYLWRAEALEAARALFQGRFDDAERAQERARVLGERAADPNAARTYRFQRLAWLRLSGRFEEVVPALGAIEAAYPGVPYLRELMAAWSAAELARGGRSEEARARAASVREALPALAFDLTFFDHLAEAAAALGDAEVARRIYDDAAHRAEHFVSGGVFGLTWEMPVHCGLGRLATVMGRLDLADEHYEAAVVRLGAAGGRPLGIVAALEHAALLLGRGELARARALSTAAETEANEMGIAALAERARDITARAAQTSASPAPTGPVRAAGVPEVASLRVTREGEAWTVECEGRVFRMKHGKGVAILARLIEDPGREHHVLDLASEGGAIDRGDAGEAIDARARDAYRARVRELRAELDEAESLSDLGRAERARDELDRIAEELARAVGLGGRSRVAASATERARVNVQRRIRDALARIHEHDPALGRHLEWAVRTGTFCSYRRS